MRRPKIGKFHTATYPHHVYVYVRMLYYTLSAIDRLIHSNIIITMYALYIPTYYVSVPYWSLMTPTEMATGIIGTPVIVTMIMITGVLLTTSATIKKLCNKHVLFSIDTLIDNCCIKPRDFIPGSKFQVEAKDHNWRLLENLTMQNSLSDLYANCFPFEICPYEVYCNNIIPTPSKY